MKLVKSLALGSAAAFVALSGAQAADLPGAEPVEYVKVCDAYGAGFFYIPGSDTCLQIGGFARLDFSAGEVTKTLAGAKPNNNTGFRARARLWFDARTDTEYGTLRTYIRAQFQRQSGGNNGTAATDVGGDDSVFDKAFVQFAGLTAGLTDSFWDFKPYPTFANPYLSDRTLAVIGYTVEFGGGFSASVAIEDGTARRALGGAPGNIIGGIAPLYNEQKYPDLVGNLRVQQGWGEAQLSGFAHNITSEQAGGALRDTAWGYGGMIGAKINLPALAKGDFIWGSAGYASGALSYLGFGTSGDEVQGIASTQNIERANRLVDFEIGAGGSIRKTEAYAFNLGMLHYWDPKWRSAVTGSYIDVNVKSAGNDWAAYTLTGNLIWSPVKKLDIGAEVNYVKVTNRSATYNLRDTDEIIGRFRVQRDF
ncbi:porin [Hansschlegelia sp.]|uniref:porin n=1 Tax=Hansschlegelia sp. TaxID=2041892 RepID=UPI002C32005C|nr:porin [Hansschlegelia sp.]HVI29055.1 porin [Hansschlegelia sp.]